MRKRKVWMAGVLAICLSSCANLDDAKADLCPDDDEKRAPGVCGCGVPDVDKNDNGIVDCLEEAVDECPNDPAKLKPGICGCGVPDTDTDGDGVPDCFDGCPDNAAYQDVCADVADQIDMCPDDDNKVEPGICGCGVSDKDTDGDTIPDCRDVCFENANKVEPGFCGCDQADDIGNIRDTDGDGVMDCLDECSENSTKVKVGSGCDVMDSDLDGLDDEEDACPFDATITVKKSEAPADLVCEPIDDTTTYIRSAKDLEKLRILSAQQVEAHEMGAPCDDEFESFCDGEETAVTCENGVVRRAVCAGCSIDTSTGTAICAPPPAYEAIYPKRHIVIENDINLIDYVETETLADGRCRAVDWEPIPALSNAVVDVKNGAVIRYGSDFNRCTLPAALFDKIIFSNVNDVVIDVDYDGDVHGALASAGHSSTFNRVKYGGTIWSTAEAYVGGLIGKLSGVQVDGGIQLYSRLNRCHLDSANVIAKFANYVGGLVGHATNTEFIGSLSEEDSGTTNEVMKLEGNQYIGGVAGYGENLSIANMSNRVYDIHCYYYCGGFAGYLRNSSVNHVRNEVSSLLSDDDHAGGFAGQIYFDLYGSIANVTNIVNDKLQGKYHLGGFIGESYGRFIYNNIENTLSFGMEGDNYIGGFAGYVSGLQNYLNIKNHIFGDIKGNDSVGGFVGSHTCSANASSLQTAKYDYVDSIVDGNVLGKYQTGGFAGQFQQSSYCITSVNNTSNIIHGAIRSENQYAGGLFGRTYISYNYGRLSMNNVTNDVESVYAENGYAGGFGGEFYNTYTYSQNSWSKITNVAKSVETKNSYAGGFVGRLYNSNTSSSNTISNLKNRVTKVQAENSYAGGLFGWFQINGASGYGNLSSVVNEVSEVNSVNGNAGGLFGTINLNTTNNSYVTLSRISSFVESVRTQVRAGGISGFLDVANNSSSNISSRYISMNDVFSYSNISVSKSEAAGDLLTFSPTGTTNAQWQLLRFNNVVSLSNIFDIDTDDNGNEMKTAREERDLLGGTGGSQSWFQPTITRLFWLRRSGLEKTTMKGAVLFDTDNSAEIATELSDNSPNWEKRNVELAGETLKDMPVLRAW